MIEADKISTQAPSESSSEVLSVIRQRLTWLMLFRVILTVGIGLSFVFLQATSLRPLYPEESLPTIISVFVGIYLFNLVYLSILRRIKHNYVVLAYIQLLTDCIGSGLLIFMTGGMESPLIFLFALHVLMGAISQYRAGAWFVVILAMGTFALLCAHEISSLDFQRGASLRSLKYILTNGLYQLGLLSFIAALTGYLSEQARIAQLRLSFASADMKTLRHLNEHFLLSVHNGIIYLDNRGKILIANRAAERFLNLSAQDLLKASITDIFPILPDVLTGENLISQLSEHFILTDSGVYSWEFIVLKDLFEKEYSLSSETHTSIDRLILDCTLSEVTTQFDTDLNRGWLIILQDVTVRRKLESKMVKRERLASLGEIAAQIAHEVRNPLAGMVSSLELLSQRMQGHERQHDPLEQRLLHIIGREAQRINSLTESFLRFSRPPKPNISLFSLNHLLADLSLIKKDQIMTELEPDITLYADADQVRQILWNLFNNAWEADSEIVEVYASLIKSNLSVDLWQIVVADRGQGFPSTLEDLEDIFRPFFTQKEQGTGLGLSLCRALAERQGGSLEVNRRKGGGAIFYLCLPAKPFDSPPLQIITDSLTDDHNTKGED
jgi:two-component system, NtrC family, sensor histidine kinase PilS